MPLTSTLHVRPREHLLENCTTRSHLLPATSCHSFRPALPSIKSSLVHSLTPCVPLTPCTHQIHASTKPYACTYFLLDFIPPVFHNIPCSRRSTATIPPIDPNPPAFTYSHDHINFGPQHALDLSCVHVCIRAGSAHNAFACTSIYGLRGSQLATRLDKPTCMVASSRLTAWCVVTNYAIFSD